MNIEEIEEKWPDILQYVKEEHELGDVSFNTWLKPLKVFSVEDKIVTILIPQEQIGLTYVSKKYTLPLQVAIAEITGMECEVHFATPDDARRLAPQKMPIVQNSIYEAAHLNPRYTFDTFIVGNHNKFAHAASLAVAESPGTIYNPLFIYGGVGLGKTHLMHSIAHFILEQNSNAKVLYITSEDFTNELIEAIRNNNNVAMTQFREKYRSFDVLLIDDVQFIVGKESTQEEFFHTFNSLHSAKKQIIISSDRPPKDMEILEDRIRSRFEWGLVADITSPDYETRMAILRKKEELDGYQISDDVIEYIATHVKSNIRELEGSLNKLMALANLENREIDIGLAEQVLQDIITPDGRRRVRPEEIISIVAEHFNITEEDICGTQRSSKIVRPRQIAMYLCREMTDIPLAMIGKAMGNKDHTTVMHGFEKIDKELQTSETLTNTIEILKKKINPFRR